MESVIENLIPDTIDALIREWDEDEGEIFRLTLLHKDKQSLYCFLSGNMQEVTQGQEIPFGITLSISDKLSIKVHYDVVFKQRRIDDEYYFLFEEGSLVGKGQKVIPFKFESEPPSVIVNKSLQNQLMSYYNQLGQNMLDEIRQVGDQNVWKALNDIKYSREWNSRHKESREKRESLEKDISALFEQEDSPSAVLEPFERLDEDIELDTLFVKKHRLKSLMKATTMFAVMPYESLNFYFQDLFQKNYKKKFSGDKEDDIRILLSDFSVGYPGVVKGFQKICGIGMHLSNVVMYGLLLGCTALAHKYTWPIISYPLTFWSGVSGFTMGKNLISSRGKDSSGLLSSLIGRYFFHRLE